MKKYIYAFFFASLIIVALGLKAKIKGTDIHIYTGKS